MVLRLGQSLLPPLVVCAALGVVGCAPGTEGDGGARQGEVPGAVGSHVWYPTSASVTLDEHWASTGFGRPAQSGDESETYERAELSAGALSRLENLTLLPLKETCTSDGYRYHVLTITDADGTSAAYADTGCEYLRLEGATVMLEYLELQDLMLASD